MYYWLQEQWDNILDLLGHDEFNIKVLGTFIVSFSVYVIFGGLFSYVDLTGRPKFLLQYKIQENAKPYPLTKEQFVDLVTVVGRNLLLTLPIGMLHVFIDKWRGIPMTRELPGLTTVILHLIAFTIIIEIAFYYSHRLMHHPYFYKRIHKKHHTWIAPVAVSAAYCHPIEHLVSNITPVILGPILLNSHIILLWFWMSFSIITTLTVHSGFHLPFLISPEFHDFHHLKFNYNYGVIGFLDYLHGTDILFRQSKQFHRHKTTWTTTPVKVLIP